MAHKKICNQCNKKKKNSFFGKDKRNKDGLQGKCNECYNANRNCRYKNNKTYRDSQKQRQKKYNNYALKNALRHISEISDTYVIASLKRGTALKTSDIRKFHELIETKRQEIIITRKLKNEKHQRPPKRINRAT